MYLLGKGQSPNYGTALVQRVNGLGLYRRSADPSPNYGTALVQRVTGMGCAGSRQCDTCAGLGIFDGGFDLSTWGLVEWSAVLLGLFAAGSMFSTTRRGVRSVQKSVRGRQSRIRRKQQLQEELSRL